MATIENREPDNRFHTSPYDEFDNPAHDAATYGDLSFAEANDYRILRECIEKHLPYFEDDVAEVAIWCDAVEKAAARISALQSALQRVEWIDSPDPRDPRYCHACIGFENHGHYDDCPIGRALALAPLPAREEGVRTDDNGD